MFNRKNIKIHMVTLIVVVMTVAMSYQWGLAGDLKGRDFVRLGNVATLEGTLIKLNAEEWALQVGDSQYDLHMGPSAFREYHQFVLKAGGSARVEGYVYNTDVGVMNIETEGQSIALRDETGRPAWAGSRFGKRDSKSFDTKGFSGIDTVPVMN